MYLIADVWEGFWVTVLVTAQGWLLFSWQQSLQGYKRWSDIFCHMDPSYACPLQLCFLGSYNSQCILWMWCKTVIEMLHKEPLVLICCLSKITKICSYSPRDTTITDCVSWVSLAYQYHHVQVLLAMCVHGAIVKCGLVLLQAVSQREQRLCSLPALHWCMTVHFLTAR